MRFPESHPIEMIQTEEFDDLRMLNNNNVTVPDDYLDDFGGVNGTANDDYYEYDYNVSAFIFFPEELYPTSIVYGLTLIIGILGNTLIIFTIARYSRMRTITNVFLASLATADLMLILICVPIKLARLFAYTWTFGEFLCKFVPYMQNVSMICSVLTMTSMSLERYYAILHPMKAKYICTISQARKVIAIIWAMSFLLAIPVLFVKAHKEVGGRIKAYWCVYDWDAPTLCKIYSLYMLSLILIGPALIMGFAYTSICREVCDVMVTRASMTAGGEMRNGAEPAREMHTLKITSSNGSHIYRAKRGGKNKGDEDNNNKTVKQVIKMLVAVVLLFILCWTPILVTEVLTAYDILHRINYGYLKPMRMVFHLMSYFNSCVNPIVYGFLSRNFRDSFINALCLCFRGRPQRQMSFNHTRTTSVSLGRSMSVSTTTH